MKMEKTNWLTIVFAILAVTFLVLWLAAPKTVTITETKKLTCIDYGCSIGVCNANSGVCEMAVPGPETIVEKTIEVPVEVSIDYVGIGVKDFMKVVDDEEDLLTCDGTEYDFDQIKVSKVYKGFSVNFSDVDEYTVNFSLKLKYLDTDTEEKCYNTFDVSVFYEPKEKPEVSWN